MSPANRIKPSGKEGAALVRLIEKQLLRLGCSLSDFVSICGDGGGENEVPGPGYVARRCLAHLTMYLAA